MIHDVLPVLKIHNCRLRHVRASRFCVLGNEFCSVDMKAIMVL